MAIPSPLPFADPVLRNRAFLGLVAGLAAGLAGCADLPLGVPESDRTPASIEVQLDQELVVEGSRVGVNVVLRDGAGRAFTELPPWVQLSWSSTNRSVARVAASRVGAGELEATGPGETELRVQVADQVARATLRVNPTAVRVETHAYLTQAVQRLDGSIPLVAGRDATLRVFVTADRPNFFTPSVRARFYRNEAEVLTLFGPPVLAIPVELDEGNLATSFALSVPGDLLRPGTRLVVEVDPTGVVPLLEGSRTREPAEGARDLEIREVAPFRVVFVPVLQPGVAQVSLTPDNVEAYMAATRAVFPLADITVEVREPYLSTASTATTEGWSQLLQEIRVLRILENNPDYYHGIVRRIAHWAGLGYVGWPVSLSWDQLPNANWTVAHEFGHNFGRRHAPCGDPGGPDGSFPHPGGVAGVHGFDVAEGVSIPPSTPDLMGYCQPRWISDYTYLAVLQFRDRETLRWSEVPGNAGAALATSPPAAGGGGAAPTPGADGLLLWGRIEGDRVLIEPPLPAPALANPPTPGPWQVVGRDPHGAELFRTSFALDELSKGPASTAHFALTLPVPPEVTARLATLEVDGPAGGATAEARAIRPEAQALAHVRLFAGVRDDRVSLQWDAERLPLLVVRDPASGRILSLARGGRLDLPAAPQGLEIVASDGVRLSGRALLLPEVP